MIENTRPRPARFRADFGVADTLGVAIIWIFLTIITLGLALLVFPYYFNKDVLNKTKVIDADGREIGRLNCRFIRAGLFSHLYLHNASQKKYQNVASEKGTSAVSQRKVSPFAMQGLLASLESSVNKLRPPQQKTEWGDYYTFTNYSEKGFEYKRKLVKTMLDSVKPTPQMVWDMGANNGEFSVIAADSDIYTVAMDIDPLAVERNYRAKANEQQQAKMLPLVQDCINPSPANGFMGKERDSLFERGPADIVMALAIIHHLAIGRNVPLERLAELFAQLGKHVIIEFVPKGDSKVDILLASRRDIFEDYDIEHFEAAMATHFKLVSKEPIKQTKRTLYLYKRK